MGPGGKGSNQAVGAARLGADVSFLTAIGDDVMGKDGQALWDEEGVDAGKVVIVPGAATMVGTILVEPDGENRIIVELPGVQDPREAAEVIGQTAQLTVHPVVAGGITDEKQKPSKEGNEVLPSDRPEEGFIEIGPTALEGEDISGADAGQGQASTEWVVNVDSAAQRERCEDGVVRAPAVPAGQLPDDPPDVGLVRAHVAEDQLALAVRQACERAGLNCELNLADLELPSDVSIAIYRIVLGIALLVWMPAGS